jgi:hypothetical protein
MVDDSDEFAIFGHICESRLIPHKAQFRIYHARDCADMVFLQCLALIILNENKPTADFAQEYAHKTVRYGNFDHFRTGGTDLYQLSHVLFGKHNQSTVNRLDNDWDNEEFIQSLHVQMSEYERWLRSIANGTASMRLNAHTIIKLERQLKITNSDYKNMRRVVSNWDHADEASKKVVLTRLLFAFQRRMRRSEVYQVLYQTGRRKDWFLKHRQNPEQSIKEPSVGRQLAIGIALGAVVIGGLTAYSAYEWHKAQKKKKLSETVTGAGNVAGIALPVGSVIHRKPKNVGLDKVPMANVLHVPSQTKRPK